MFTVVSSQNITKLMQNTFHPWENSEFLKSFKNIYYVHKILAIHVIFLYRSRKDLASKMYWSTTYKAKARNADHQWKKFSKTLYSNTLYYIMLFKSFKRNVSGIIIFLFLMRKRGKNIWVYINCISCDPHIVKNLENS